MRTVSVLSPSRALLPIVAVVAALCAPGVAAADLFINGENVTGIRNVSLVNARVRIDERGNVHVDAPGYTVRRVDVASANAAATQAPAAGAATGPAVRGAGQVAPNSAAAPAQAPLTRRYYLVTHETGPTQYDLEVFVNGTSIARVRAGGDPVIDLLNRFLRAGRNEIRVVAHKVLGDQGRRSQSPNHTHRVLIGEGSEEGGQVTLDSTFVDYSVNASQLEDQTSVFTMTAR